MPIYKYPQRIIYTCSESGVEHTMLRETEKFLGKVRAQYAKTQDEELLGVIEQVKSDIAIYHTNYALDMSEYGRPRVQYLQWERADEHLSWCGCPTCRPFAD